MARLFHDDLSRFIGPVLVLGTLAIYAPVVSYDFTTYDDPLYVTENARVQQGLSAATLLWAFSTGRGGNWHPLTWLSHALDWQLYGAWPGGHHLTNLLLHLANALLLFTLVRRLTRAPWRSALVAGLFAWHPLHVESVAWVAERKDVLSACCWWLALHAYVTYARQSRPRAYRAALLWFALGLLAKPMVVSLPCALLLLDYWPLRRGGSGTSPWLPAPPEDAPRPVPWHRLVLEKWPFFALAAASSVVTFLVQKSGGAVVSLAALPLADRLAHACLAYVAYLARTFWPRGLAVFYPLPESWSAVEASGAALLLAVVTAGAWVWRRRQPWLLVGWVWFVVTLLPVIGLVQVGLQFMADRYTYIPLTGLFLALVWGLAELVARGPAGLRTALQATGGLALLGCLALTALQVRTWQNAETLFRHALAVSPDRFTALNNLARALGKLGRIEEAAAHFEAALALRPGAPLPLYNLGLIAARQGDLERARARYEAALHSQPDYAPARFELANLLANQGQLEQAAAHYRACLRTAPGVPEVHRNLALVLVRLGALQEAVAHFRAALRLDPDQPEAHSQLAAALHKLGQPAAARHHYQQALRLRPDLVPARLKLGLLLAQQGQLASAEAHFRAALRFDPTNTLAHYNLAAAHAARGQLDQAAAEFAEVVRLNPADADARGRLGIVLLQAGRAETALPELREALRQRPDWVEGLWRLANLLATHPDPKLRNGAEAVALAERAAALTDRRDPLALAALDAAYAEAGRFEEAIRVAEQVRTWAATNNQPGLAEQATRRLECYRAGQAYRQ